ncbi:MAG: hypothetical protein ABR567_19505 [Myxococcales bacterium]
MRRVCLFAFLGLFACKGSEPGQRSLSSSAPVDAGPSEPPPPPPGLPPPGHEDAGTSNIPDAGSPDAGPVRDAHRAGGLGAGPFSTAPLTVYGSAQGILEFPVVAASVDEGENLWVVTEKALYLMRPGSQTFRRYTAADGLHVGPGYTEPPDITLVEGGAPGEAFVGYYCRDTNEGNTPGAHTNVDPYAHCGKMDQVLLKDDGTLTVNRYDLRNSNDGHYYETRTIMSMVYDHFQHPGNLYVGSNHGITRIIPSRYFPPRHLIDDPWNTADERVWYADHVHPWVCNGGPCSDPSRASAFGDWFGLTLADDGRLWMGGLTNAGAIHYREALDEWVQSWQPHNPFDPAFGDPYPGSEPVFDPPREGDPVNIRAVAVTKDGTVWFASGEVEAWRGPTYGLASWGGKGTLFTHIDPTRLGSIEYNILELQALPDGRLVLGFPNSGLLVWQPGDPKGHRLTMRDGLPGEQIGRVTQDRMHDPPILFVPTDEGLAAFRQVP